MTQFFPRVENEDTVKVDPWNVELAVEVEEILQKTVELQETSNEAEVVDTPLTKEKAVELESMYDDEAEAVDVTPTLSPTLPKPHPIPSIRDAFGSKEMDEFKAWLKKADAKRVQELSDHNRFLTRILKDTKKEVRLSQVDVPCPECGGLGVLCQSIMYGRFCVHVVHRYHFSDPDNSEDRICAKKLFIDHYSIVHEYNTHKETRELRKVDWVYPPECMRQNCYLYVLGWLVWARNGKLVVKGQNVPPEWHLF